MKGYVSIHKWLGRCDELKSPENMQFTTRPAKSCRGCLFQGQHSAVCDRAGDVTQLAELEHCTRGFIYVEKPADPRQVSLIDKAH
jgi:hypothetical protein